jgi:hypothetical protein
MYQTSMAAPIRAMTAIDFTTFETPGTPLGFIAIRPDDTHAE